MSSDYESQEDVPQEEQEQEQEQEDGSQSKKRKIHRACDVCRRKKIKCDGGTRPGQKCSPCVASNSECTYLVAVKKRRPLKGYVETLETRLEKMEALLQQFRPDINITQELKNSSSSIHERLQSSSPAASSPLQIPSPSSADNAPGSGIKQEVDSDDDEYGYSTLLSTRMTGLTIDLDTHQHFLGKSSNVKLVRSTLHLQNEHSGRPILATRRPEFWAPLPWEKATFEAWENRRTSPSFPAPDLLASLVDLYFENVNIFTVLLHRPTFQKALDEELHMYHDQFRQIVLLVCANGARFSDDPRVFIEGDRTMYSSGWKWFTQVDLSRKSLLAVPTLYDLQVHCLAILFIQTTSVPQISWAMVGHGIRLALDVGAHRRKVYDSKPTIENELWKRAFWCLVVMDRSVSSALGRPCAIQEEDFDLDLPIECDDEYWSDSDSETAFQQPAGKPSTMSFYVSFLKLFQIHAFALRTIYSINKSKVLLGFVGPQWEQNILAQLDSVLNKWADSVPDHLRWDPTREDPLSFLLSGTLYCTYYHLQIFVHRPFITSTRDPASALSFSSLAVCTNAARSCIRIDDVMHQRFTVVPCPLFQVTTPSFASAVVLMLNIWSTKRTGMSLDVEKEMELVHRAMEIIKSQEHRYYSSGRSWDILFGLASMGDLPLPPSRPTSKRGRGDPDDFQYAYRSDSVSLLDPSSSAFQSASTASTNVNAASSSNMNPPSQDRVVESPDSSRRYAGSKRVFQNAVPGPSTSGGLGPSANPDMQYSIPSQVRVRSSSRNPTHRALPPEPSPSTLSTPNHDPARMQQQQQQQQQRHQVYHDGSYSHPHPHGDHGHEHGHGLEANAGYVNGPTGTDWGMSGMQTMAMVNHQSPHGAMSAEGVTGTNPTFSYDFVGVGGHHHHHQHQHHQNGDWTASATGMGHAGEYAEGPGPQDARTEIRISRVSPSYRGGHTHSSSAPSMGVGVGVGVNMGMGPGAGPIMTPLGQSETDGLVDMWSNVPSSFAGGEWDAYIASVFGTNQ